MHELDLHGYTVSEALNKFVDSYNQQIRNGVRGSIRVIHGYGSSGAGGKIQRQFRKFLQSVEDCLHWTAGEDVENNPGVTIVQPRTILPDPLNQLAAEILVFCSTPRTESKLAGQFRKHSAREIKEAIRSLVRAGLVKAVVKNGHKVYESSSTGNRF